MSATASRPPSEPAKRDGSERAGSGDNLAELTFTVRREMASFTYAGTARASYGRRCSRKQGWSIWLVDDHVLTPQAA